jgi:Flp pilus assembly protein CpaB
MPATSLRGRFEPALSFLSGWPRRLLALGCLALAATSALSRSTAQSAADSVPVVVAAHGLPAGCLLQATDLRIARWPTSLAPVGAASAIPALVGRPLSGPMSPGEAVTPVRLLDTSLTASLRPGQVAAAVRLPDRQQAKILRAGSVIDLYLPPPEILAEGKAIGPTPEGRLIASGVRVLAVLDETDKARQDGASVVIAADRVTASHLANQPSGPFLATLRPPS